MVAIHCSSWSFSTALHTCQLCHLLVYMHVTYSRFDEAAIHPHICDALASCVHGLKYNRADFFGLEKQRGQGPLVWIKNMERVASTSNHFWDSKAKMKSSEEKVFYEKVSHTSVKFSIVKLTCYIGRYVNMFWYGVWSDGIVMIGFYRLHYQAVLLHAWSCVKCFYCQQNNDKYWLINFSCHSEYPLNSHVISFWVKLCWCM
jgi:hypothetical protein